jgi:hypothetical protein
MGGVASGQRLQGLAAVGSDLFWVRLRGGQPRGAYPQDFPRRGATSARYAPGSLSFPFSSVSI